MVETPNKRVAVHLQRPFNRIFIRKPAHLQSNIDNCAIDAYETCDPNDYKKRCTVRLIIIYGNLHQKRAKFSLSSFC